MVFSEECNFREFRVLEKIIHRKQKFYMVHTLFLTDSRKFNPTKYTTYTVNREIWQIPDSYKFSDAKISPYTVFPTEINGEMVGVISHYFTLFLLSSATDLCIIYSSSLAAYYVSL